MLDAISREEEVKPLAVFPEWRISGTVGLIKIGGSIDYLVAPVCE
jgi:hypothetical protein